MEKLIELLNEYEGKKTYKEYMDYQINEELPYKLDSLEVLKGFIKWLVENDKIDRERINDRWGDMSIHFTDEQLFIMSLSISDTPIEDLILYLK